MSFKREGNDSGLLSVLQKRRIKDLLAEDIPEDEAKLLSNGRFTCVVCNSIPIFDTVDMLCVHRNGKKHKASVEYHKKKKEELKQLIAKRRHEQFVKTGSDSILMAQPQHSGISTSSPYDSRARRNNKGRPGDRKQRVDLHEDMNAVAGTDIVVSERTSDSSSSLTPWQNICDQQTHGGFVTHDSQLKNIFCKRNVDEPVSLRPYTSSKRKALCISSFNQSHSCDKVPRPSISSSDFYTEQSAYSDIARDPDSIDHHTHCLSDVQSTGHSHSRGVESKLSVYPPPSSSRFDYSPDKPQQNSSNICVLPPPPPPPPPPCTLSVSDLSSMHKEAPSSLQPQVSQSSLTNTQNSIAKKYHQLQGSGWKKDWDGKWIKDEEAEFDSDEEPPDLP